MKYPDHLLKLIALFRKLPGVGNRTAERFAFQAISWEEGRLLELAETLSSIKEKLKHCDSCGALIGEVACTFCSRQADLLCIVAYPKDVFLIEETRSYHGFYHVLGGLLSPLNHQSIDLNRLKMRINTLQIKEVILALDPTLEGDATALYLKRELALPTTRLALGLPMGSSLDLIDGGTLARALCDRRSY